MPKPTQPAPVSQSATSRVISPRRVYAIEGGLFVLAAMLVVISAVLTKEAKLRGQSLMSLVRLEAGMQAEAAHNNAVLAQADSQELPWGALAMSEDPGGALHVPESGVLADALDVEQYPADIRWFDGRPVRPGRVMLMTVTGYSPDERSCGPFADGQTATLHSVWTNGMRLVAADTTVLPFGSMLTVPGYADESIVPVLDRGGAIKGARLDLLFATHELALQWGVQEIPVVVWEYADGEAAPNPREVR